MAVAKGCGTCKRTSIQILCYAVVFLAQFIFAQEDVLIPSLEPVVVQVIKPPPDIKPPSASPPEPAIVPDLPPTLVAEGYEPSQFPSEPPPVHTPLSARGKAAPAGRWLHSQIQNVDNVIIFGGVASGSSLLNDLWVYNGAFLASICLNCIRGVCSVLHGIVAK